MKVTGIGLLVMGGLLMLFSLVYYLVATAPSANNPESHFFEPIFALGVGVSSAIAGGLILWFGGRGYTEAKLRPVAPNAPKM